MDRKYQIFISSTYKDLIEQRDQVVKTVLRLGHLPAGMEMFNAADEAQWEVIKRHINNSDYYLVILAHRYGSLDSDGIGFTEKEYDYAVSQRIPCMAFVIDDRASWPHDQGDEGELREKLKAFKDKVRKRLVNHWTTTLDLGSHVLYSLTEAFNINPRVGWVRANEGSASPQVLEEIARLSRRNNELESVLADINSKKDGIIEAQEILESRKIFLDEINDEISLLEVFSEVGHHLLEARGTISLERRAVDYMQRKGIFKNGMFEKVVLKELLESLAILDMVLKSTNATSTPVYVLTSKGKALLAKKRFGTQ